MTCAACANRIERKLNKVPGVVATVNYATEKAKVSHGDDVAADDLVTVVESAGYGAQAARSPGHRRSGAGRRTTRRVACASGCSSRLVLTVPVVALAMVPAWQFTNWQWLSLALAAPVVVWGALPFHRAAWANLRHGSSTMDTLISMGTLAAFGWSLYALFFGTAGEPGMTHPFELTVQRSRRGGQHLPRGRRGCHHVHPGRALLRGPVEAAGRRRPAGPARAGLEATSRCCGTASRRGCRSSSWRWATGSSYAPGRRSPPTAWSRRAPPPSTPRCSPGSRCRSRWGSATPSSARPSTSAGGSSYAPPGSARTPSSPRWRGWSRTPRTARPRPSGWPTGSPGVFVPVVIALVGRHPRLLDRHGRGPHRRRSRPPWPC